MTDITLTVVAVIKAKPGKEEALEALLHDLVTGTHAEPGCITYMLHKSQAEAATYIFIERWRSAADLDAHFKTPHLARALRLKDELIAHMEVHPIELIGQGDPKKNSLG